jgi:hypothetical protein
MQTLKKVTKSIERFKEPGAIHRALEKATDQAFERHKRLGESVAVWQDGQVVILKPEEIPHFKR